ncbi:MAG TPA: hypothetical protein VFQ35_09165, partial [Polyangiaceae bacterium]|nr:hypothetical protein [Polyangiaceae bacterium]
QPTLVSPNDRACGAARYARQQTPNGVRIYELAPAPARFRQELRDPLPDPPIDIFRCTAVQSAGEGFVLGKDVTGSFPKTSTISVGSGAAHVELSRIGTSTASASRPSALLPRQEPDEFVLGDGRHCRVREATDGTLRCAVLEGNAYQNGFVDPECKVRLYELSSEVLEDAVAHPSWLGVSDYDSRGKLTGSYSLERYTGDTYEFSSGTCLPADSSSSNRWVANQRTDFTEMPLVELRQL